ncbi:MAG: TolC family outer membrane protein [Betaproteobacteria bacterium]|nr:TolC family outer membrane protein [Betaproteobacteria bacterium]
MRNLTLRCVAAASLGVIFTLSGAQMAHGAGLLDVYKQAREADATYAAARTAWKATQEKLPQARAGLLPDVAFSASTQFNDRDIRFRDNTPAIDNRFNSSGLNLSLRHPLYRRQNNIALEQGRTQVEQADTVLAQAAQDLITRVAQAYMDVLLARDNVAFAAAQKAAIAEQLAQAKLSFEIGTVTITDTHEALARFDLADAQEIAAKSDMEVRQRALELLIGRATPALAALGPGFRLVSPDPLALERWVDEARIANLQVRAAQFNVTLAQQDIERNRAGHMPTLDAVAGWSRNRSGAGTIGGPGTDIDTKSIGVQLAIPIYQGGLVNSRVREAAANEERTRQELETARRNAELQARQNYVGVTSGIAQVKALEAALISSRSALESTLLGRQVGVRTQVDVLNAQQQLFSARRDLAQARYNYILATLRLKAAAGRLAEQDVVAVNAWLERGK